MKGPLLLPRSNDPVTGDIRLVSQPRLVSPLLTLALEVVALMVSASLGGQCKPVSEAVYTKRVPSLAYSFCRQVGPEDLVYVRVTGAKCVSGLFKTRRIPLTVRIRGTKPRGKRRDVSINSTLSVV